MLRLSNHGNSKATFAPCALRTREVRDPDLAQALLQSLADQRRHAEKHAVSRNCFGEPDYWLPSKPSVKLRMHGLSTRATQVPQLIA